MRFAVNLDALARSRLTVSSKLLALARIVHDQSIPEGILRCAYVCDMSIRHKVQGIVAVSCAAALLAASAVFAIYDRATFMHSKTAALTSFRADDRREQHRGPAVP